MRKVVSRNANCIQFLSAFAKLRKATIGFVMSVCPSVHVEQLGYYRTDFPLIWHLSIFLKLCRENSNVFTIWQN